MEGQIKPDSRPHSIKISVAVVSVVGARCNQDWRDYFPAHLPIIVVVVFPPTKCQSFIATTNLHIFMNENRVQLAPPFLQSPINTIIKPSRAFFYVFCSTHILHARGWRLCVRVCGGLFSFLRMFCIHCAHGHSHTRIMCVFLVTAPAFVSVYVGVHALRVVGFVS